MGIFCCKKDKETHHWKYFETLRLTDGPGEYYGEYTSQPGMPVLGVTMYNNRTSKYNYIGYHRNKECTGYGEAEIQPGNYEAWGVFNRREPCGLCRVLYSSNAEYIGLMNMTHHGRGKIKYSKLENEGQYKGYFDQGLKHYYGEEKNYDWYYIGEFTNDMKGPFGKLKQNNGNSSYSYKGIFKNGEPDGFGIMKTKYYDEEPMLDWALTDQKPVCKQSVKLNGLFRKGVLEEGIEEIKVGDQILSTKDIKTKTVPEFELLEKADSLQYEIQQHFDDIYQELYFFKLADLKALGMKIELIADKMSTVRLKISKQDAKKTVVFGKGRLCGNIDDIAYASYEAYVLELLQTSNTAYKAHNHIEGTDVFPVLYNNNKLHANTPRNPVYYMGINTLPSSNFESVWNPNPNSNPDPNSNPNPGSNAPRLQRHSLILDMNKIISNSVYYHMTFMEYYKPDLFLSDIVKTKNISLTTLTYLFYKTLYSLQILEYYGVFLGQVKLSSIYVNKDELDKDDFIKLVGYSKARIVTARGDMISRWNDVDMLKGNLNQQQTGLLPPNVYKKPDMPELTPRDERPPYHDYIITGEYKNKKSLYLPSKIKKELHSTNWKDRVYETHYGRLTLFSLAMSFLKAFAIILSMEEKESLNYKYGTCYKMLQKCKLFEFLDNPEVSYKKCMEEHEKAFGSFIKEMKETIVRKKYPFYEKVIELIDWLAIIDNMDFANDFPKFESDQGGVIIASAKEFLSDMEKREYHQAKKEKPQNVEKSSIFIKQITKRKFVRKVEEKKKVDEEFKEESKKEFKSPETYSSPYKSGSGSTMLRGNLDPIQEEEISLKIGNSSKVKREERKNGDDPNSEQVKIVLQTVTGGIVFGIISPVFAPMASTVKILVLCSSRNTISIAHFQNIDFATARPTNRRIIFAHHPECRPQTIGSRGKFYAGFDFPVFS